MKPIYLDPRQGRELERRRHETADKRLYERLSAALWVTEGKARVEVADLLGCSVWHLAACLRLLRNRGFDALCTLRRRDDSRRRSSPAPPLASGRRKILRDELCGNRAT